MQVIYKQECGIVFRIYQCVAGLPEREQGSSLIETALILPFLLLLLVGAVDLGRAWYVDLEVASAAEAGSLYGVQNFSDTTGMNAAALMNAPDITNLQSSSTYGYECSDGSSVVPLSTSIPTCAANAIAFVEVDTTTIYKPIFSYPGLPSPFVLSAKSRLRTSN